MENGEFEPKLAVFWGGDGELDTKTYFLGAGAVSLSQNLQFSGKKANLRQKTCILKKQ